MFRAEESITRLLWIVFGNRSQSGLVLIARAPLQTLAEEDLAKEFFPVQPDGVSVWKRGQEKSRSAQKIRCQATRRQNSASELLLSLDS
jgi:hypothetical protein